MFFHPLFAALYGEVQCSFFPRFSAHGLFLIQQDLLISLALPLAHPALPAHSYRVTVVQERCSIHGWHFRTSMSWICAEGVPILPRIAELCSRLPGGMFFHFRFVLFCCLCGLSTEDTYIDPLVGLLSGRDMLGLPMQLGLFPSANFASPAHTWYELLKAMIETSDDGRVGRRLLVSFFHSSPLSPKR